MTTLHLKDAKATFVYAELRAYVRGFSPLTSVVSITNKHVQLSSPEQTCRTVPVASFAEFLEGAVHARDSLYAHICPSHETTATLQAYAEMNALRYFSVKGVLILIPELDEPVFVELHAHEDTHDEREETAEAMTPDGNHFLYGRMVRNKYASPLLKEFSFIRRELNSVQRPQHNKMLGLIGKLIAPKRVEAAPEKAAKGMSFEEEFMQLSNDKMRELMQKRMRQRERDGDFELSHWVQGFFMWLKQHRPELELSRAQSLVELSGSNTFEHMDAMSNRQGRWNRETDIEELLQAAAEDPTARPSGELMLRLCADLMRSMTLF